MKTEKTKAAFKPITVQLGIIVRDLEKAMQDYSALLSIGPWEIFDVREMNCRAAIAMLGTVEVELIQPLGDEGTIRKLFGDDEASFNHVGFYIDDPDAQIARFEELGVKFLHKKAGKDLGCESSLMNLKGRAGTNIELLYRHPKRSMKK